MIYTVSLAAVWWGEKKCITLGVAPPGRQMNKIERGDIANKGDIVCDADDSQEAEEPLSACDTSSLKPSPALPFSDLFCSPSTPLSSLSHFFSTLVPAERPGYLSLSPFSLPHLIPVWKALPFSFLDFFTKYRKPDTPLPSHQILMHIHLHTHINKYIFSQTFSPA